MPQLEPVDHDPFANPKLAFMPVDHNPFEDIVAGSQPLMSQQDLWFSPRQMYEGAKTAIRYPFEHPAETAQFGLSLAPGSGEAMSAADAWNASGRAAEALQHGDYGGALSGYADVGTALLGTLPGAGIVARGTKRGAQWMDRNVPKGVNKLLDAMMPKDASRTTFMGAGPTAVPMDEASRMERATQMGYADEPFYRGEATGATPSQYDTAFFSRDPEYAQGFAQRGGQEAPREFRLNLTDTFSDNGALTAGKYGSLVEAAAKNDPALATELAESIAPGKGVEWLIGFAKANPDFVVVEPGAAAFVRQAIETNSSDPVGLFRSAGFNAIDSGRDVRKLTGEGIRLKNARFDPSKASSRDIMAGIAGASLLPAYLLSTSHQDQSAY